MGIYYVQSDCCVILQAQCNLSLKYTMLTGISTVPCFFLSLPSLSFGVAVEVNNVIIVSGRDNSD